MVPKDLRGTPFSPTPYVQSGENEGVDIIYSPLSSPPPVFPLPPSTWGGEGVSSTPHKHSAAQHRGIHTTTQPQHRAGTIYNNNECNNILDILIVMYIV
jgi:hypothetical protein